MCLLERQCIMLGNYSLVLKLYVSHGMRKLGFRVSTRSDTKQPVQSWKKARNLQFQMWNDLCTVCVEQTKALNSCAVTAQLLHHSFSVSLFSHRQKSGFLITQLIFNPPTPHFLCKLCLYLLMCFSAKNSHVLET